MTSRVIDFRFPIYRGGFVFSELTPIDAPVITVSADAEIHSSLSGTFAENPLFNILTDEIRPQVFIDGVASNLGVFLPATMTTAESEAGKRVSITAYDKSWLLKSTKSESIFSYSAGSTYHSVIINLLSSCGITALSGIDLSYSLQTDREDWPVGTSYLTIINTLLDEINYLPVSFDSEGNPVLQPEIYPGPENVQHVLDSNNPDCLLAFSKNSTVDYFDAPNVFILQCNNPDFPSPLIAKAENNFPSSPLSTVRRGRRILSVSTVDNIASQAALNEYARLLMLDSLNVTESVTVTTGIFPGWGVGDVVALHFNKSTGIFRSTGYSMTLQAGGSMNHNLKKVEVLYG